MSWLAEDPITLLALLLRISIVVTLVLLSSRLLNGLLSRHSAAMRHLVWVCGLVTAALLPVVALSAPLRWGDSIALPVVNLVERVPSPVADAAEEAEPGSQQIPVVIVKNEATTRIATIALWVWLAGASLVLLHVLSGALRLRHLIRRSRPLADSIPASSSFLPAGVRAYESTQVSFPIVTGLARPVIVLPEGVSAWPSGRLRYALLHELAHVRRRDVWWAIIGRVAVALHWFNPLAWSALRGCAREAERACDDAVLEDGVRPSAYAGYLLDVARRALRHQVPATAVGQGSELEGRISAVLQPNRARSAPRPWLIPGVLLAALAAVGFGTHRGLSAVDQSGAPALSSTLGGTRAELGTALVALLRDEHSEVRAAAARSAGQLHVRAAIPHLSAALSDPSQLVRSRAARALGDLEAKVAIGALQRALLSDRSHDVRREAAAALGEMESAEAVAALASAFSQVHNRGLVRHIVRALGETGSPAAVAILEPLVTADGEPLIEEALAALTDIESPAATSALLRALQNDNPRVRRLAARAVADGR